MVTGQCIRACLRPVLEAGRCPPEVFSQKMLMLSLEGKYHHKCGPARRRPYAIHQPAYAGHLW